MPDPTPTDPPAPGGATPPPPDDSTVIVPSPAAGAGTPPGGSAGTAPPPPGGPPPLQPPPGSSGGRRIMGMGPGALAALAVSVVVIIGAVVAVLIAQPWSSSSEEERADDPPVTTEASGYAEQVAEPLDRLTSSAISIGTTLASTTRPEDLSALGQNAERQRDVVEQARRTLAEVPVDSADQEAQAALLAAAALQRRYLVTLSRSVDLPPEQGLRLLPQVRTQAQAADERYAAFFALVPQAPDAITATDLDDTAGLQAALEAERDAQAAPEPEPEPVPDPEPVPGTFTGQSFSSPTGNLRCGYYGTSIRCSSANDGFSVGLDETGDPYNSEGAVEAGGTVVPYGQTWSSGVFLCDSAFDGITCRSTTSGHGFFLNRDSFDSF